MIQAIQTNPFGSGDKPAPPPLPANLNFMDIFDGATQSQLQSANQTSTQAPAQTAQTAQTADVTSTPASSGNSTSGDPNVQGWLNSYYTEMAATNPNVPASSAQISYQPASGAGSNYTSDSIIGPDQVYTQAIYNQNGNLFANATGDNAATLTSQLPSIPNQQAQQEFDSLLAIENAQRLASGSAIDTSAYWSDPGSVTLNGTTYTSQQLGYVGPCQSSGPQPIYIDTNDQVAGTNSFSVPGYQGTVTGIEPGKYYTLAQLEQAGLPSGQADAQYHPGSWTMTQSS